MLCIKSMAKITAQFVVTVVFFANLSLRGVGIRNVLRMEWTKRMILHGMAVGRDVVCTICRKTEN